MYTKQIARSGWAAFPLKTAMSCHMRVYTASVLLLSSSPHVLGEHAARSFSMAVIAASALFGDACASLRIVLPLIVIT